MIRGAGPAGRFQDVQGVPIRHKSIGVKFGDIPDGFAFAGGTLFHFIVAGIAVACQMPDIGDVHDVVQFIAVILQRSTERVFENIGAQIADVRKMVNGRTAAIHLDGIFAGKKAERFFFSRCGVVELK